MVEKTLTQRIGVTPVKGGLIVVLAIVLIAVVISQITGDDPVPANRVTAASRSRPAKSNVSPTAAPQTVTAAASKSQRAKQWKHWSRIPVEEASRFNPLKLPERLQDTNLEPLLPERDESVGDEAAQKLLERRRAFRLLLEEAGVRAIVMGRNGRSAYIGNQLVREGDVVHGFMVKEIGEDGVELVELRGE